MIDLPLRFDWSKYDPMELLLLPGPKPILDRATREGLVQRGWTRIRQSDLADYRSCPASLQFTLSAREGIHRDQATVNQFLGSLLHEALAYPDSGWFDPDWWKMLAGFVRARHPNTVYSQEGRTMTRADVDQWCHRMVKVESKFGDRSVAHLLLSIQSELEKRRLQVLAVEERVSIPDGPEELVSFDGTLDFVVRRPNGQIVVLDLKSYGLLDTLLLGEAPKAQRPKPDELRLNNQLRHYGFLLQLKYRATVSAVGHIYPANLCPQLTGPDAGKPKGPTLVIEPLVDGDLEEYQHGLVSTLRQAALPIPWAKTFPEYFGAPKCIKNCRNRDLCFNTDPSESEDLADLFSDLSTGKLKR